MKIYWCKHCEIPVIVNSIDRYNLDMSGSVLSKCDKEESKFYEGKNSCPICSNHISYMTTDLRPVFMAERIMLSELTGVDYTIKSIWNGVGNRYFVDGEKVDISLNKLYATSDIEKRAKVILDRIQKIEAEVDFSNFINANQRHYQAIEAVAFDFIKKITDKNNSRIPLVLFSGGKDSTAVSDLTVKALNNMNILHVFGDTTLEFPFTYDYLERFKGQPIRSPFLPVDKVAISFNDLLEEFGPPSRVMRWCCTIYKTGPIGKLFRQIAEHSKILTFYGIRRSESNARSEYKPIAQSPKITQQLVVSPILGWYDIDVWLYLLTRGIDFNDAYRLGFTRVGCWCCPNNSDWSAFLCKIFMQEEAEKWRSFLIGFAKKIGKPDPEVYVDEGWWKARQGGQGLNTSELKLEETPCALEDNAKNYSLKRPIDDSLYEFFKPFGQVVKGMGKEYLNEVYVFDAKTNTETDPPLFILQGNKGSRELKVRMVKPHNSLLTFQRIECQLRKYQLCIHCSACMNVCPFGAINLTNGYKIDEEKCKHCAKCIAHFHKGCLITKIMIDY
ncbi:MAG: phosphoadenosine phosphosulfate reductase family protein [Halanaerobiales bacterium]|nr:phosphoadenosine phosphosulfate reductase family protein [Halanaerobiales bacterium]